MRHVARLTRVESLEFFDCRNVTDEDLALLSGLLRLRVLDLFGTSVTGPGLKVLTGMTRLERLGLLRLPLSNSDLENLAGLTSLKDLEIDRIPRITARRAWCTLQRLTRLGRLRTDEHARAESLSIVTSDFSASLREPQLEWESVSTPPYAFSNKRSRRSEN